MAGPNLISQDNIFFIGVWSRHLESTILSKLDFEQWNNNWIVGDYQNNREVIRLVGEEIKVEEGIDLPFAAYLEKLQQWEDRFKMFKYLISRPDVFYHPHENTVEASVEVWTEIARTRPDLLVYRPKGEPCWDQLRVLFREVVVISDSQSVGNARSGGSSHGLGVSEVVNQPSLSTREFYDCIWTREMENRFIEMVLDAKRNGSWRFNPDWRNPAFVENITPKMNREFQAHLPATYYADKVERLFERQNIFQFIKGHHNVYWNEHSNDIEMDEATFSELATTTGPADLLEGLLDDAVVLESPARVTIGSLPDIWDEIRMRRRRYFESGRIISGMKGEENE
ncbi:hypothetical protein C2S52_014897 [Perilla frutescens var. hirtella]|nr:hypothetical protein C2S52_014897 [Perilla frutescens var. hirtella]